MECCPVTDDGSLWWPFPHVLVPRFGQIDPFSFNRDGIGHFHHFLTWISLPDFLSGPNNTQNQHTYAVLHTSRRDKLWPIIFFPLSDSTLPSPPL